MLGSISEKVLSEKLPGASREDQAVHCGQPGKPRRGSCFSHKLGQQPSEG